MDAQIIDYSPYWRRNKVKRASHRYGRKAAYVSEESFRCKHCQAYVYTSPLVSGVQNRNHCPYCLTSRHVDLHQAGDRLSACKATMQPIGLTVKPSRNKYGDRHSGGVFDSQAGELMIIHRCSECNKVSINRIASDDSADELESLWRNSAKLDGFIRAELENLGIRLLLGKDIKIVAQQLYGCVMV